MINIPYDIRQKLEQQAVYDIVRTEDERIIKDLGMLIAASDTGQIRHIYDIYQKLVAICGE